MPNNILRSTLERFIHLELEMAEYSHLEPYPTTQEIDLFVCLSGRGLFDGTLAEEDKIKFEKIGRLGEIDTQDTIRRMLATISLAKAYYKNTGKHVPIYFNGVDKQNAQLQLILAKLKKTHPFIIIDKIYLPNTVGQSIALRYFVENNPQLFSTGKPRICLVSSSFHIPRVTRTFGNTSPLLAPEFFRANPDILAKLPTAMQKHMLQETCVMKQAVIFTHGIDRHMTTRLGSNTDILCEIDAIWNYSQMQTPPSIAGILPSNCLTQVKMLVDQSIAYARVLRNLNPHTTLPFFMLKITAPEVVGYPLDCNTKYPNAANNTEAAERTTTPLLLRW